MPQCPRHCNRRKMRCQSARHGCKERETVRTPVAPAPTTVWISSMNSTILPFDSL